MTTQTEECRFCRRTLRGNPNSHQCEGCLELFCSRHARMVEWGIRYCVNCKPIQRRGRRISR